MVEPGATSYQKLMIGVFDEEIILNHHGQIAVRSEKDELTEFTITLPLWEEKSV